MTSVKEVLDAHSLRPKKHFGQNFMADRSIAQRIAELATTPTGGTVVEFGAGLGALTLCLLERASTVIAIERDRELVPVLAEALAPAGSRAVILEADAKAVDLRTTFAPHPRPHVLAGNLPYQLTGPLLERTVRARPWIDAAVFLVQLEVASRLCAAAGSAEYGALTVFVRAAFDVRRAFIVRRGAFYPQPNVDSAVVHLQARKQPVAEETATFQAVVHAAFAKRRKTLRNAWRGLLGLPEERIAAAADAVGIKLTDRGETLPVETFAAMARELDG